MSVSVITVQGSGPAKIEVILESDSCAPVILETKTRLIEVVLSAAAAPGLSAYQVAVAEGFSGTQAEWLETLKGTDGIDGIDGLDGATWQETFETVSANLANYAATVIYTSGFPTRITYDLGSGYSIIKTIAWTNGLPSSITLSGDTPGGISPGSGPKAAQSQSKHPPPPLLFGPQTSLMEAATRS